jgi:hypothetical protein
MTPEDQAAWRAVHARQLAEVLALLEDTILATHGVLHTHHHQRLGLIQAHLESWCLQELSMTPEGVSHGG